MLEITEEQMNFLRTLLITPSFFVQNHTMTLLNEAGTALHLSYEEIQAYLPNDMDTIALQQISFSHDHDVRYYSMSGKKCLYHGEECWLLQILPIANEEAMHNLYRVSTARKIMLQMANDFNHITTDQSIYEFILENCGKAVQHSDLCSLMIVEGDSVRIVAKRGYNNDVYNVSFEKDKTFLGMATQGKYDHTVIINDLSQFLSVYHTEIKTETHAQLLSSTLSAPVYVRNELYAILCFDSEQKDAFTEQDLELLELVKTNVETMLTNYRRQMEILHLSKTDMLTGLYNRTYLKEYLDIHNGEPFYVGMFDMNDLKGTNDGHGHSNGDLLISKMAEALQRTFPTDSAFFRFGGDEFVCILKKRSEEEILEKIAALRKELLASPLRLTDGAITTLSFSCGFAKHEPSEDFETALSKADHQMYDEKRKLKRYRL